ncbi:MAG: tetratricopeptide repeat protein [Calothrix sp. CSU_2_0]|nr:tetratricopeptide repeat protein [Calothrix sp. CSU_2_0]
MTNENSQGINIKGGKNEIKDNTFNFYPPEKPATAVNYIPYLGIPHFVGRSEELEAIHEKLYAQNNTVAISAVSGMGGVGKTELAVKYAREHTDDYPGGICWLNARDANLGAGIIQFVQLQMGLEVPQQDFQGNVLTLVQQVAWCWQNWRPSEGLVLVVLDDVTELKEIKEFLPKTNNRFRILITTRQRRIDINYAEISLNVLSEDEALSLLKGILGEHERHLIERLQDEASYKVHPLIREFLQAKLTESAEIKEFQQAFTNTFMEIAQTIPQSPTLEFIDSVKIAIPHLTEVAENLIDAVSDENLIWAFTGLAWFYNGQGLYALAEPWCEQSVSAIKSRLGENHPDVATSLNNLAALYNSQGRYEAAEPLLIQALELKKQLLGENHPHVAISLNNLAELYRSQGRYEAAEPLYLQALEIAERVLGTNHPNTVTIRGNLEYLRTQMGKSEG